MDKFIVRAVGIINKEIELTARRLSVSSLSSLPLGVLGASLIGASNDEELVGRGGSSEVMPCDDPVAVRIQGDVDKPDQAQRQEYDPLEFGALDLVPTNNTGNELETREKGIRPDPKRNDNRLSCGIIRLAAQRSIPSKKEGTAQCSIHSKKEGAATNTRSISPALEAYRAKALNAATYGAEIWGSRAQVYCASCLATTRAIGFSSPSAIDILIPVGSTRGRSFARSSVPERFSSAFRVALALGRFGINALGLNGPSSVDATRGYPWGTSSNVDGTRNTSGAGFAYPEETSGRRRREETPSMGGLLKSPGDHGEEVATADAVTRGAKDEGRADRNIGRLRFLLSEAQRTGQLGGSKMLNPATL
ncbi:hypothetical protein NDU88_001791 [Pleurodeles waltl]|uniref:Uncharacterized protein n=1 Tax=Pleurodeles waltl TaxID=8319 RepID=A0AAV7V9B9_PLEWA|nr:hypothetical protein NDU88_001791 [Pleurodeles waltl]